MDKLLRLPEVAEMTGLPENTLRFWRHQGTGPKSARLGRLRTGALVAPETQGVLR